MTNNVNMTNREVCDLIFVDYTTKKPFMNLDFANVSTTELTGESVFAYGGKGHPKRVRFAGERGGTLTIETQLQTVKLWQMVTGGDFSTSAKFVTRVEETAKQGVITLKDSPAADSVVVYAADDDCGTPLACTVSGNSVTLGDTSKDSLAVIVYYMKTVSSGTQRISIKSTSFPKNFTVYGSTVMNTEDGDVLPYKLIAYKAAPQANLSLSFSNSGDPGSVTITCDLMADNDDNMLDLVLLDSEETDEETP